MQQPGAGMLAKLASVNVTPVLLTHPGLPYGWWARAALAAGDDHAGTAGATQISAWIGQALAFVFGFIGDQLNHVNSIAFLTSGAAGNCCGAEEGLRSSSGSASHARPRGCSATATLNGCGVLRDRSRSFPW